MQETQTDNPEDELSIPSSLLIKLFDATGTKDGSQKGYMLFFINENGEPFLTSRFENTAVQFALERAMEIHQDNEGISFNFSGDDN